jgi:hypothetical protein
MRPEMCLDGAGRVDPRLLGRVIRPLVDAFAHNQGTDEVAGWNLTIESDSRFVLDVDGRALNAWMWSGCRRDVLTTTDRD